MSKSSTKDLYAILEKPMGAKRKASKKLLTKLVAMALTTNTNSTTDKVAGDMSVPHPVTVDSSGTMTADDFKACSLIMSVCQNMVQKSISDAAKTAGIDISTALKNMDAWVQAYVNFPFPFFNYVDVQHSDYKNSNFSLTANPDIVGIVLNIKDLSTLKDAVVAALKTAGGNLVSIQNTDTNFNYFGIVTVYNDDSIRVRVVKFQMNMKSTNVNSLCVALTNTTLDSHYDTYQFSADKNLMIAIQKKIGDQLISYYADKLWDFIQSYYDQELVKYQQDLVTFLKSG